MKKILFFISLFLFQFPLSANNTIKIAASAEDVKPLLNGQQVPDAAFQTVEGKTVELQQLMRVKPTVFIFYRGGWCPYCSAQLAGLRDVEKKLIDLGYQIVAISPDSPERIQEQSLKTDFDVQLMSDNEFNVTTEFGLGFFLDSKTANRYRNKMGIEFVDIEGTSKVALPVPAVYIADTSGLIHFQYVNPNFRVRIDPELIYQAAKILDL